MQTLDTMNADEALVAAAGALSLWFDATGDALRKAAGTVYANRGNAKDDRAYALIYISAEMEALADRQDARAAKAGARARGEKAPFSLDTESAFKRLGNRIADAVSESREMLIPFSGWQGSDHQSALDYAASMAFQDPDGDLYEDLYDRAAPYIDWQHTRARYARDYAACFLEESKIRGGSFAAVSSPVFYNFETDRLFANIPLCELLRLAKTMDPAEMDTVCNRLFTSYDGFVSFYSPDWRKWGATEHYDHNQAYAVMLAWWASHNDANSVEDWQEEHIDGMNGGEGLWVCDDWLFGEGCDERLTALLTEAIERRDKEQKAA